MPDTAAVCASALTAGAHQQLCTLLSELLFRYDAVKHKETPAAFGGAPNGLSDFFASPVKACDTGSLSASVAKWAEHDAIADMVFMCHNVLAATQQKRMHGLQSAVRCLLCCWFGSPAATPGNAAGTIVA